MEVETLKAQIDSIVVKENKRKMNQATNAMWAVVQKNKFSLYGFFDLWKQQNTVSPAAVAEMNQKLLSILNVKITKFLNLQKKQERYILIYLNYTR